MIFFILLLFFIIPGNTTATNVLGPQSEDRIWDGGGGDNLWMNPLNWSNDALPEPDADVIIQTNVTVIYDHPSFTVESISILNNAHLIVAEGAYLHSTKGAADGSDGFRLTGINADTIAKLTVYGHLDITMDFAAGDGMDINKFAEVFVAEGGLLSISNPSESGIEISDKLTNAGTITITNTGDHGFYSRTVVAGGGVFNNTSTGVLLISETGEEGIYLESNIDFTNDGLIKVFDTNGVAFDGDGNELYNFGTFEAEGLVTSKDFVVENGSSLKVGAPIGILSMDDNMDFSNSTMAFEIEGNEAGTEYDQLMVTQANVNLTNTTLNLSGTYIPQNGEAFMLMVLDESGSGHFIGLPEGAIRNFNGVNLYITYKAGDLNDVALVADAAVLVDADGDGSPAFFDCDDNDPDSYPGATEICDGADNNCNGAVDEGLALLTYYRDADGDGYGNVAMTTTSCAASVAGYVSNHADCNDQNGANNPAASEICDNVDNNCNGSVDEGLSLFTYYRDADGDGYGNVAVTTTSCATSVAGYVSNHTDCNDQNGAINPAASEICDNVDNNCNGSVDEGLPQFTYYQDADGDGYGNVAVTTTSCATSVADYVSNHTDCNDQNGAINPAASEICDNVDNNCNGLVDEGLPQFTYYQDADGDGYGNVAVSTTSCAASVAGYVSNHTDCNDQNGNIKPDASEICDGVDNNCNGSIDEGLPQFTYYQDTDGDGYGNVAMTTTSCASSVAGYVSNNTDCNDQNGAINPAASEIYDGVDNNCNGSVDEGLSLFTYYQDADGDGYGNVAVSITSGAASVAGYVLNHEDCNDQNGAINPAASEICDNADNNCNGSIDEALTLYTYYQDADGDGYGNTAVSITSCATSAAGYVSNHLDCNDQNGDINPAASEICDGVDNNCNGAADEGLPLYTFYQDADGDGYGNIELSTTSCATVIAGYVSNHADCDDQNESINPGASEICDGVDNNCNGSADEGLPVITFYQDADGDAYGNDASSMTGCEGVPPDGFVTNGLDCDDTNNTVYPEAPEICDDIDNNCDELIDEGLTVITYYEDADGDAYGNAAITMTSCEEVPPANFVANDLDCDDTNNTVYPGATEICDDIDNNCNELADEDLTFITYYEDADSDGYGNAVSAMTSCEEVPPVNFVANDVDCDDTDPNSYQGAMEIPDNGIDENCDGIDSMTTSVKTVLFSIQAAIYPNPTSGQLHILAEADELTLRIYDVRGALVMEHFFTEKTTVDLSHYSAGVYLIQLFSKEGLWMGKVLKD